MNTIPYWVNENRGQVWQDECIELRRQVRELKDRAKRLEEAGDGMLPFCNPDYWRDKWKQAKEAA